MVIGHDYDCDNNKLPVYYALFNRSSQSLDGNGSICKIHR